MEYKVITEDRFDDVIRHLKDNFFSDEPLNKAANLCTKGYGNCELERLSYETLIQNLSLMAVNEHDEITAVVLNAILTVGDLECALQKLEQNYDYNFKKIFRLLYTLNLKANIFKKFGVDKVFDLRILSVDSRFRGQGLAKELVRRSENLAKECGIRFIKADATGIFSQRILISNGFEVLLEQYYNKYTDDSGEPILQVEPPHIKLQVLYKQLLH